MFTKKITIFCNKVKEKSLFFFCFYQKSKLILHVDSIKKNTSKNFKTLTKAKAKTNMT